MTRNENLAQMGLRPAAILTGALLLASCASLPVTGGTDDSTIPAEIATVLARLFQATTPYAPPTAPVDNLPSDLDPLAAMALRQLNWYRAAAGLAPYRYDQELTKMATAHVRYAAASSRANLPWGGHYEVQGQPGYSKEGNDAASTSGIAYGTNDPVDAVESLMEGVYHRLQFLRPDETRVGVGFGAWEGSGNSIGLFVTRSPAGDQKMPSGAPAPRFMLFPPPDAQGIGCSFQGEEPDPRPGYQALSLAERVSTGYPITISFSAADAKEFQRADVRVGDGKGEPIDCWVTDPVHPSNASAPAIYAEGVSKDWAFARNFDAVFIMPKAPLQRGMRYTVRATLFIGSQSTDLSWSFATAPALVWKVAPKPIAPWQGIGYALAHASQGDTVQLEAGVYDVASSVDLSGVRLVGAGQGKSRLRFPSMTNETPVGVDSTVAIEKISLESPGQLLYLRSGSTLLLRDVGLAGGNGKKVAIGLERGATLVADNLDASRFDTFYLCYSLEKGKGGPPAIYHRQVAGVSADGGLVYGPADLYYLHRALSLP